MLGDAPAARRQGVVEELRRLDHTDIRDMRAIASALRKALGKDAATYNGNNSTLRRKGTLMEDFRVATLEEALSHEDSAGAYDAYLVGHALILPSILPNCWSASWQLQCSDPALYPSYRSL